MKYTLLLFAFLICNNLIHAQFGVTSGYRWNNAPNWKLESSAFSGGGDILGDGYSVGVDYWFRLKNYRVEFQPELNFSAFTNNISIGEVLWRDIDVQTYSFFFNTNLYLFDFMGDCDCPTFSKQGDAGKKGFFVQISPGVSYFKQEFSTPNADFSDNSVAVSLGAGIGFDIGLTDLVTLTPLLGARYYPNVEWSTLADFGIENAFSVRDTETSLTQLFAGARLGFRFDYQSNRRRR
ncbi:MAG: hypothetical protein ACK4TA_06970 [Saprospiraceae bacterium]